LKFVGLTLAKRLKAQATVLCTGRRESPPVGAREDAGALRALTGPYAYSVIP